MRDVHSSVPDRASERGTKEYGLHERIWSIILPGPENALNTDEIAVLLNIKHTRTNQKIRKVCNELRQIMKRPIFSCTKGYYKAIYSEDVQPYVMNMINRRDSIQDDIDTAQDIQEKLPSKKAGKGSGGYLFPGVEQDPQRELRM